jgi:hypothetical protein
VLVDGGHDHTPDFNGLAFAGLNVGKDRVLSFEAHSPGAQV